MTIPAPNLDDLRFQKDIVDEARKRIIHYCPEWTEYNLSDPGITLIELFAWMTEMMVFRLNRVPEKNYLKFLEMLGLQRKPANSAATELTFWLSIPLPINPGSDQTVLIPRGTEIRSDSSESEITFSTDQDLKIVPPLLFQVRRESDFNRNFSPRLGVEIFHPFGRIPKIGDTFYLGFDPGNNICGHILQLNFKCDPTEAVGIRREDPPWVWECQTVDGKWVPLKLSTLEGEKDTTGGLNNAEGSLVLYLPLDLAPGLVNGLTAIWIRCRIEQRDPLQGIYSESPRIKEIDPFSIGGVVPAKHATNIALENLGVSTGEPGQSFTLQHSPVLLLNESETLEVEESVAGETVYVPWQKVQGFSHSTRFDRHYIIDTASGKLDLGPAVKQQDGTVSQYGRIPESGRRLRFSRYRYGGGVAGNVPAGSLTTLGTSIAYVARVSNLIRAVGGRDQETVDELKLRAQRELQSQHRAVTASDYEQFTLSSSRSVARARCVTPNELGGEPSGMVTVFVVPAVQDAINAGDLSALHVSSGLQKEIKAYLDQYRLLTSALYIREPRYYGVKIKAKVVPQDFLQPDMVKGRIQEVLKRYLSPLPAVNPQEVAESRNVIWDGWPFGRDLFPAEIISLIQQIPQVKYVLEVEVFQRTVVPVEERSIFEDQEPPALLKVNNVLSVDDGSLVCSLDHEIEIVDIHSLYEKGSS